MKWKYWLIKSLIFSVHCMWLDFDRYKCVKDVSRGMFARIVFNRVNAFSHCEQDNKIRIVSPHIRKQNNCYTLLAFEILIHTRHTHAYTLWSWCIVLIHFFLFFSWLSRWRKEIADYNAIFFSSPTVILHSSHISYAWK